MLAHTKPGTAFIFPRRGWETLFSERYRGKKWQSSFKEGLNNPPLNAEMWRSVLCLLSFHLAYTSARAQCWHKAQADIQKGRVHVQIISPHTQGPYGLCLRLLSASSPVAVLLEAKQTLFFLPSVLTLWHKCGSWKRWAWGNIATKIV